MRRAALAAAAVLVLGGCGGSDPAPSADEVTTATLPADADHMEALGTFTLRYDEALDCVWLEDHDGTRVAPVWDHGTRVLRDPVRAVDREGGVLVEVDETFQVAGGGARLPADGPACGADRAWAM